MAPPNRHLPELLAHGPTTRPHPRYTMSPWKKYRQLGVFPSKVLFHVLLIATSSHAISALLGVSSMMQVYDAGGPVACLWSQSLSSLQHTSSACSGAPPTR